MSTNNPITRPNDPATHANPSFPGLTKREHFAAIALQGLVGVAWMGSEEEIAKASVKQADALINALNQ